MGEPPPGRPAEEAERLVVAALAALSSATRGWLAGAGHGYSTGTQECCVCPLCRGIAAVKDPSPEFAERLASGAAELAGGLTTLLRAVGEALSNPPGSGGARSGAGTADADPEPPSGVGEAGRDGSRRPDPWRMATGSAVQRERMTDPDISHQTPRPAAKIAKKAVHKVVPKGDPPAPVATNNGDAAS